MGDNLACVCKRYAWHIWWVLHQQQVRVGMSEYIELKRAELAVGSMSMLDGKIFVEDALAKIADLPTIDIVRCEECDYWTYDDIYDEHICGNSEWTCVGVKADDFCSRGERSRQ